VSTETIYQALYVQSRGALQRATNENTNGLLRQYFPKSSDLSAHSADDLNWVAAELNDRPRKRLGFKKPIEQIGPLLLR
jgi:IS30 family transposase